MHLVPRGVGHAVQQPRELSDVLLNRGISLLEIPQVLFEFLPRAGKGPEQQATKLGPGEKMGPWRTNRSDSPPPNLCVALQKMRGYLVPVRDEEILQ